MGEIVTVITSTLRELLFFEQRGLLFLRSILCNNLGFANISILGIPCENVLDTPTTVNLIYRMIYLRKALPPLTSHTSRFTTALF